jgi:hypothetical protein
MCTQEAEFSLQQGELQLCFFCSISMLYPPIPQSIYVAFPCSCARLGVHEDVTQYVSCIVLSSATVLDAVTQ